VGGRERGERVGRWSKARGISPGPWAVEAEGVRRGGGEGEKGVGRGGKEKVGVESGGEKGGGGGKE